MKGFRARFFKPALALLAGLLLAATSFLQRAMNLDRERFGLTRLEPLENAPPILAFTTVALGGFRGIIANILWIRMTELQDQAKFFEMVQLADWIAKLQPHFPAVWIHLAWNMSYNISVKFAESADRWPWVERGIELLRDDGLRYNPQEPSLYRELAWHFQHKIGAGMDDANFYYKIQWAKEMNQVLGQGFPDYGELLRPTTADASNRVERLRKKYKMDPEKMRYIDQEYGPFDWRLPEAHSVYWAKLALDGLASSPNVKEHDITMLRRSVFQSMQLAFHRGRLIEDAYEGKVELGPNLEIIPNANRSYEQMMQEDPASRDNFATGHRNFIRDAVYFLFVNNRLEEAANWYRYLGEKYPDRDVLEYSPGSLPSRVTLSDYVVGRVQEAMGETSRDKTTSNIQGFLRYSFYRLALGQDNEAAGYALLAQNMWETYQRKVAKPKQQERVGLDPFEKIRQEVLDSMLNPTNGLNPVLIDRLRTRLRRAPGANASTTNAPPAGASPPQP